MKSLGQFALIVIISFVFFTCKKDNSTTPVTNEFKVIAYEPVSVTKTATPKVYAHLMPWFETKETNEPVGKWGIHWTMSNQDPDIQDATGKRQIAAHFYPLIGPYSSGDPDVIEYQLLLMKLSGIDGVLIDWPGMVKWGDWPLLVRNTDKIIELVGKVGLQYAIVYEDNNKNTAFDNKTIDNKVTSAKEDMAYLDKNYFGSPYYIKISEKPLLLVFGPQAFQTAGDWTDIFAALGSKPVFLTLWYESQEAGTNAGGEYAWIYKDYLTGLDNFYRNRIVKGVLMGAAYPGFKTFYEQGGWGSSLFELDHNGTVTFDETLKLALKRQAKYIQLATWNDYGEGTMIEPTQEFGYGFLALLQTNLGVSNNQSDLELVEKLFKYRKKYTTASLDKKKMDQVFYLISALQLDRAKSLIDSVGIAK